MGIPKAHATMGAEVTAQAGICRRPEVEFMSFSDKLDRKVGGRKTQGDAEVWPRYLKRNVISDERETMVKRSWRR